MMPAMRLRFSGEHRFVAHHFAKAAIGLVRRLSRQALRGDDLGHFQGAVPQQYAGTAGMGIHSKLQLLRGGLPVANTFGTRLHAESSCMAAVVDEEVPGRQAWRGGGLRNGGLPGQFSIGPFPVIPQIFSIGSKTTPPGQPDFFQFHTRCVEGTVFFA